MRDYNDDKGI